MSCCSVSSSGQMEGCCPGESLVSVQKNIAKLPSVCRWPIEQVSVIACPLSVFKSLSTPTSNYPRLHYLFDTGYPHDAGYIGFWRLQLTIVYKCNVYKTEMQLILKFEKLEPTNIWRFCLMTNSFKLNNWLIVSVPLILYRLSSHSNWEYRQ